MSDNVWTQYAVRCSDGELSQAYESSYQAKRELERIESCIAADPRLAGMTARIVTREVEAGEWDG